MKNLFTIFTILFLFAFSIHTGAQWQQTNGPHGGFITCAANNETEIYVGTQYGGVFRSTNQGDNWAARNNGLKNYEINCIALDGDELYVGTRLGGLDGIAHSSDDGMTWETYPNLWTSYESSCIAASGNDIYVGTAGGGNFFSHDGGQSWSSSNAGIQPSSSYSTSQILILENKVLTIINGKLYESFDGGFTCNLLDNGFATGTYISKVSMVGANLFAATTAGLYTSTDAGLAWVAMSANLPAMPYGMSMSAAENSIYVGGALDGSILFSNNNGNDWTTLNTDWGTGVSSFFALSDGELLIQAGNYSVDYAIFDSPKLHYTNNNGSTWTDVTNEITSTWCMTMTDHGDDIYVGTIFTGMYKTSDEGDTWELTATPDHWVSFSALATFDNTILASGDGGILRSLDNGDTWTVCNQGLPSTGLLGFAQVGADIFAASPMGVVISTDDGQTWSDSSNGITEDYILDILAVDNVLYAVTQTGIYTSVNFGNSWININNDLPSDFTNIYHISNMGDVLIVAGGNSGTLHKSTNGGANWTSMNFDEYGWPSSFAVHDEVLFVSAIGNVTSPGVFMTNDLGETWTNVSDGLDNNQVWDVIVHNDWAFACTKGSGVYKRPISDFTPQNISDQTQTNISIYPNPASDNITINIPSHLIGSDAVITNELGQEVQLIGNITTTNFQVDCSTLESGFYVVKIGDEKVKLVVH